MNGSATEQSFRLLQISSHDSLGGAARIALNLHRAYIERGIDARLAVGTKQIQNDPAIFEIPNDRYRTAFARNLLARAKQLERSKRRGFWRMSRVARGIAEPKRWLNTFRGVEDFDFPAAAHLLDLCARPDLLHCHNLHGEYFDLRALPELTRQIPTILTLHDAWLLSGHCAHSGDCDRWKTGCGNCPDLNLYPGIRRDRTHANWLRKKKIFQNCKVYVVTPSRWLMDKVEQSILLPATLDRKVIPNGIDLELFYPANEKDIRSAIGIANDEFFVLVSGSLFREKVPEAFDRLIQTLGGVSNKRKSTCLVLGSSHPDASIENWNIRFLPHVQELTVIAEYYRAADMLLHVSRADTFPTAVLEALASGIPVIASAVGGIPEQIRGLKRDHDQLSWNFFSQEEATGILIGPDDVSGAAAALDLLMNNQQLRLKMGQNARADATNRFSFDRQVEKYLDLYTTILRK